MEPALSGSWNYPTRVLHGPGRVRELGAASKAASISRPLIVTDTGLRDSAIVAGVQKALAETAPVYSGVKGTGTGDEKSDTHEVTMTITFKEIDEMLPQGTLDSTENPITPTFAVAA